MESQQQQQNSITGEEGRSLLEVDNLRTHFNTAAGVARSVDGISFSIPEGKTFALVGESGCGKSVTALSIMQLLPKPASFIPEGRILFEGTDLIGLSEEEKRNVRGNQISMIFQEPQSCLNPVMRVGRQVDEILQLHQNMSKEEAKKATIEMFEKVRLPDAERQYRSYPHELSGGMKQRVMIAMALACKPKLLIADEPTTALDVTVQGQILALIKELQSENNMAVLLITHDLGVVAETADEVGVMYAGRIVERAAVRDLLKNPQHPYTQRLLESIPSRVKRGESLRVIPGLVPSATDYNNGCRFAERCHREMNCCKDVLPEVIEVSKDHEAACLLHDKEYAGRDTVDKGEEISSQGTQHSDEKSSINDDSLLEVKSLKMHFPIRSSFLRRQVGSVKAVDGIDFIFEKGKTVALVGESGCGKTTAGKSILQLLNTTNGEILFKGQDLTKLSSEDLRPLRQKLQIIFQDPFSSLNPRMMVRDIIAEGLYAQGMRKSVDDIDKRVRELLETVQLPAEVINRYPHEFSGGQRQRIGIARALAVNPEFIVCDEVTSALDVSVQAQILNLLGELQKKMGLTYLFVTHDLSVVGYLADTIAVMYLGRIVEYGTADEIFNNPKHPYTQALFAAAPNPDPDVERNNDVLEGDVPSPSKPPVGCHFHPRCPSAKAECKSAYPIKSHFGDTHYTHCHLYK